MASKAVNISAQNVVDDLNLVLPSPWTVEAGELDTVCINHPAVELGYIVQLVMCDNAGYSFQVAEFQFDTESGKDYEDNDSFLRYDEALAYIRRRVNRLLGD